MVKKMTKEETRKFQESRRKWRNYGSIEENNLPSQYIGQASSTQNNYFEALKDSKKLEQAEGVYPCNRRKRQRQK